MKDDAFKKVFAIILAGALLAGIDSVRADCWKAPENVGWAEQGDTLHNQHVGLDFI